MATILLSRVRADKFAANEALAAAASGGRMSILQTPTYSRLRFSISSSRRMMSLKRSSFFRFT